MFRSTFVDHELKNGDYFCIAFGIWKMMLRFVRTMQIRDESGDNAAHGKEIGMKSDRLWMIAPAGRLIPNDITSNYLKLDPKVQKVPKAWRVIPKFHGEGIGRLVFYLHPRPLPYASGCPNVTRFSGVPKRPGASGFSRDRGLTLAGWGFQEVWRFQNPRVFRENIHQIWAWSKISS